MPSIPTGPQLSPLQQYAIVTANYWAFTLSDGALRMLVVFHFHQLGYSTLEIAFLFLFYEFFGIVTNLGGGWLGARFGLRLTLWVGTVLQIGALLLLVPVSASWPKLLSVLYVMAAQAISGIAKDLNKMSAKSAIRVVVPATPGDEQKGETQLFRWVAILTGSKNALKGVGFFLFGARDVWFVVALPVFLEAALGWRFWEVGGFLGLWVIGYGIVQGSAPALRRSWGSTRPPGPAAVQFWAAVLTAIPALIAVALWRQAAHPGVAMVVGLATFGAVFAMNSSIHSYLVLAFSESEAVSLNVGFYYMANAAGRLLGTLLSGWVFLLGGGGSGGMQACLWCSALLVGLSFLVSLRLPNPPRQPLPAG